MEDKQHYWKQRDVQKAQKVEEEPASATRATEITIPSVKHQVNDDRMIEKLQKENVMFNKRKAVFY